MITIYYNMTGSHCLEGGPTRINPFVIELSLAYVNSMGICIVIY